MKQQSASKPDYGIDAPAVMRNLFLFGGLCLLAGVLLRRPLHLGPVLLDLHVALLWTAAFLLGQACLYLLYVKVGKLRHRDFMLSMRTWRGDEQVLDVGCGRGLLLIGAAKRLTTGHATGLDIWSTEDLGGNSLEATTRNLEMEGVRQRCTLRSEPVQNISDRDETFDVVLSNLCLHNIYDAAAREAALQQIVRVLKPGGVALISDYKLTPEYARSFKMAGLDVERRRGSFVMTFPPLTVVVARKPVT